MNTVRVYDGKAERARIKYIKDVLPKPFFIEKFTNTKKDQFAGIDVILSNGTQSINVDVKQSYKDYETFLMEISFTASAKFTKRGRMTGWFAKAMNGLSQTDAYLLLDTSHKGRLVYTKDLVQSVFSRVSLDTINKINIALLNNPASLMSLQYKGKPRLVEYNGRTKFIIDDDLAMVYSPGLPGGEAPINLTINKRFYDSIPSTVTFDVNDEYLSNVANSL